MDLQKLQRIVVDALEDVKAQDIKVFNTVGLSDMFDRVVLASGTSNRQSRALAWSVVEKVKEAGGQVVSVEGTDPGEWVLVDLGDIVVHIMQPAIRQYYGLEEMWGSKPVKIKLASEQRGNRPDRDIDAAPPTPTQDTDDAPAQPTAEPAAAKKVTKKAGKAVAKPAQAPTKKAAKAPAPRRQRRPRHRQPRQRRTPQRRPRRKPRRKWSPRRRRPGRLRRRRRRSVRSTRRGCG